MFSMNHCVVAIPGTFFVPDSDEKKIIHGLDHDEEEPKVLD